MSNSTFTHRSSTPKKDHAAGEQKTVFNSGHIKLQVIKVQVDKLLPGKNAKRGTTNRRESIRRLAATIRRLGLLQPILVRKSTKGFMIVAGNRRVAAVKSLGHKTIDAIIVKPHTKAPSQAMALVENLQRESLHPVDLARGLKRLKSVLGVTDAAVAELVGISRSQVSAS